MAQLTRFSAQPKVVLTGSEKVSYRGQQVTTPSARGKMTVSVLVPRKTALPAADSGVRLTEAQFARAHGADASAVKQVSAFAAEFGLQVEVPTGGHRSVRLTGSAAAMSKAFGVTFAYHSDGERSLRSFCRNNSRRM